MTSIKIPTSIVSRLLHSELAPMSAPFPTFADLDDNMIGLHKQGQGCQGREGDPNCHGEGGRNVIEADRQRRQAHQCKALILGAGQTKGFRPLLDVYP